MAVDKQRNVLYVLTHRVIDPAGQILGEGFIEVIDLGVRGDGYAKVMTISQSDIARAIQENIGIYLPPGKEHTYGLVAQYKIASIQPIACKESLTRQLLVVTENCLRIYIQIEEEECRPDGMELAKLEEAGL